MPLLLFPLLINSSHLHFKAIDRVRGGDKEGFPIPSPKTHIGSPRSVYRNVADFGSPAVKDGHAFAGQVDISLMVNGHAVGSHFHKKLPVAQVTAFVYVIN